MERYLSKLLNLTSVTLIPSRSEVVYLSVNVSLARRRRVTVKLCVNAPHLI